MPGAWEPAEVQGALEALDKGLAAAAAEAAAGADEGDDDEDRDPPPVSLSQRAFPLRNLLERAIRSGSGVSWGAR